MNFVNLQNPINRSHPLNRGREAWWKVIPGRDKGPLFWDLCGKNHGTLTNGAAWTPRARAGGFGYLQFDGTDDYVDLPIALTAYLNGSFTMATWATITANADTPFIIGSNLVNARVLSFRWGGSERLYLGQENVSVGASVPFAYATYGNTPLRILVSYNGTAATFYVNGVSLGSDNYTYTASYAGATYGIGGRTTSKWFVGSQDDVSIWSRALSASEARTDYNLSQQFYPGVLNSVPMRRVGRSFVPTSYYYRQMMEAA